VHEGDPVHARWNASSEQRPNNWSRRRHESGPAAAQLLELLSFYNQVWSSLVSNAVSDAARARQENAERVITITKAVFILAPSAFEFSAKQAVASRPGRIAPITGRLYLRKIIHQSIVAGLLPAADDVPWDGVIQVRNMLVHNN
jgi:hypothetical protein